MPKQFSAVMQKSKERGSWTYVVWPESTTFFKTRGLVKIKGTIDGKPFQSSFMAMGGGQHMLPIKAETRKLINKEAGKRVTIVLTGRIK